MGKFTPGPWCVGDMRKHAGQWLELPVHVGSGQSRGNAIAIVCMGGGGAIRNEPGPIQANAALIAASPELLEALTKCRDVFMRYAELHAAKGTPEGVEKAKANHDLATMCEAAISRATQTEGK